LPFPTRRSSDLDDLGLSFGTHRLERVRRNRVRNQAKQFRRVQIGQRIYQPRDLGRLQTRDLAVIVTPFTSSVRVATQEFEILPVDQATLSAPAKHTASEAAQYCPGACIRASQPQAAGFLAKPEIVGPERLATADVHHQ